MVKRNKLLFVVCFSASGLGYAAVESDTRLKSIKIEQVQETLGELKSETVVLPSCAKQKSLLEKCLLTARSMGLGAVSLACGACMVSHTGAGLSMIANGSRDALFNKSLKGVYYLGGAAIFMLATLNTFEYSREALRSAFMSRS